MTRVSVPSWVATCATLALMLAKVQSQHDEGSSWLKCPPPPADCAFIREGSSNAYSFNVSAHHITIRFADSTYFSLTCEDSLKLEDPALPRFKRPVRVTEVIFVKCAPPINASYAAVLTAFNVTNFTKLKLKNLPATVVTHQHLADLQKLTLLEIIGDMTANVSLAPGAFSVLGAVPRLQTLTLQSVRTTAADLAHLPPSLKNLKQLYVDVNHVYFNSLPNLMVLELSENYTIALNLNNTNLKMLFVSLPNNVVPEDALPQSLAHLTLTGWNDTQPVPKTRCAQLQNLQITGTHNQMWPVSLPDKWLSNCSRLKALAMYKMPIGGTLPARLLEHASKLEQLTIQHCNLHELPLGLLNHTSRLTILDLSFNNLIDLPSALFVHTQMLKSLILSYNQFTNTVARTLSAVTSLNTLRLNGNPQLGDLCSSGYNSSSPAEGTSALKSLKSLQKLYLRHTSVTHVCRDWRHDLLDLVMLDLRNTNITVFNLTRMQFRRTRPSAKVLLHSSELQLQYSRQDYRDAVNHLGGIKAQVIVETWIARDCRAYWTVMEYNRSSTHALNITLAKFYGMDLSKVDVDTLTCDATEQCKLLALPANCSCGWREDLEHGELVFVECAGAGLTTLPVLPPDPRHKWRLHLANNNISHVAAAHVAHVKDIVELDLRNNLIKSVDGDTALNMASVPLRLGGNKLNCGCESLAMLTALVGPKSQLRDKVNVTCANGLKLASAPLKPCDTLTNIVAAALPVLMVAGVAVSIVLARPETLTCVKAVLVKLGWIPQTLEPFDEDRRFDVFVSYANEDEELVVEELAARLESGARPYRLCLHYRDWAPGEWIPAQIAASVRASRRTLAIVSRHYLESGWARAEFREATAASLRDATPRLVVVLLDEPDGLVLDPELDAYVRNNTYVRWGDAWFWEKLRQALPPPRSIHQEKTLSTPSPAADIPIQHECAAVESIDYTTVTQY